jgi:hypothetical protein
MKKRHVTFKEIKESGDLTFIQEKSADFTSKTVTWQMTSEHGRWAPWAPKLPLS